MRMEISPGDEPPCEIFDSETMDEKRQRAVHEILTMGIQERINTQPNVTLSPAEKTGIHKWWMPSHLWAKSSTVIVRWTAGANQTREPGETNGCLSTLHTRSHESGARAPSVEVW